MFQVTYKKQNGEVFNRIRNTLPYATIGEYTSMGWLIIDIKRKYGKKYYNTSDYYKKYNKNKNINQKIRLFQRFLKSYTTTIMLLVLIPLYIMK